MRGVLFSREEAARAQQVRAEIGRLLRQHYDASLPPISEHLAEYVLRARVPAHGGDVGIPPKTSTKSLSIPSIGTRRTLKDLSVLGCTPPLPTLASTRRSQQIK